MKLKHRFNRCAALNGISSAVIMVRSQRNLALNYPQPESARIELSRLFSSPATGGDIFRSHQGPRNLPLNYPQPESARIELSRIFPSPASLMPEDPDYRDT
ncbi:hypothetical protein CDAR_585091 [Caerostris darwini]|uniref:Uncharacterized protein n=1 Tax=Caerostris darwini TaxID=1538125 RepID=A0AAV4T6M6_9ARAC|nr:hypothetical protein CDAR_585091 [Caerostris darwini]